MDDRSGGYPALRSRFAYEIATRLRQLRHGSPAE
jgi:hypothetical protein